MGFRFGCFGVALVKEYKTYREPWGNLARIPVPETKKTTSRTVSGEPPEV